MTWSRENEPPVGTWVIDRFGATHYRVKAGGWSSAPTGFYAFGKWEAMWEHRGPLVECGPWGAPLEPQTGAQRSQEPTGTERIREMRWSTDTGTYPGKVEWGCLYPDIRGGALNRVSIDTEEQCRKDVVGWRSRGVPAQLVRRVIPGWDEVPDPDAI